MSLQSIIDAVGELDREINDLPIGDPRLRALVPRLDALEREVHQEQGLAEPLVPDAERPSSAQEATAHNLERALRSLREAVTSKST